MARTEILDVNRLIDYDRRGHLVGIEFLHVSGGVRLDHLPYAEQLAAELLRIHILTTVC